MTFATKTRRASILSNLFFSLPLTVGLLGSAIPASAQTNLDVNVPFAFSVGNQHLPAGHYRVSIAIGLFLVDSQRQDGRRHSGDGSFGKWAPSSGQQPSRLRLRGKPELSDPDLGSRYRQV
jgi:hypothetical protein